MEFNFRKRRCRNRFYPIWIVLVLMSGGLCHYGATEQLLSLQTLIHIVSPDCASAVAAAVSK